MHSTSTGTRVSAVLAFRTVTGIYAGWYGPRLSAAAVPIRTALMVDAAAPYRSRASCSAGCVHEPGRISWKSLNSVCSHACCNAPAGYSALPVHHDGRGQSFRLEERR